MSDELSVVAASNNITGIRFPGKYLQGPEAIRLLGAEVSNLGGRAVCLIDRGITAVLEPLVKDALTGCCEFLIVEHGGECTLNEITSVKQSALTFESDVVIGVGGGKVLDTAKAVADSISNPSVVVPTIAASDAPCSALAIIYHDDGSLDRAMHLTRNPDVVIADTQLIAAAPSRFLSAGMGDGLATWLEADACRRASANNTFGFRGVSLAYEIAAQCRDTIFKYGIEALAQCDDGQPGEAFERIVEANILLSGLGFESCGVAAAHGVQDGLCELPESHGSLHGEKVSIGILAELKLQSASQDEFLKYENFLKSIRLPTRLSGLGMLPTADGLAIVARRACRPGDIIHNEPMQVTEEMVVKILSELV